MIKNPAPLKATKPVLNLQPNRIYFENPAEGNIHQLTTNNCLVQAIGDSDRITIQRSISTNSTLVKPSQQKAVSYELIGDKEIISGVPLRHSQFCPPANEAYTRDGKSLRMCCCVLLKTAKDEYLITKRSPNITFPRAWVLPGGGLDKGQSIMEGGLRECMQEVGMEITEQCKKMKMDVSSLMAWESFFVKDNHIQRGNLILFMAMTVQKFPVVVQEEEVETYDWKQFSKKDPEEYIYTSAEKGGFGQGHLTYLTMMRELWGKTVKE